MPKGAEKLGAWWDESAAQAATAFFPHYLRHTEGEWAGRSFVLSDWQRDRIIRPIFGWKRADGTRLIRIAWIEVPRKNGKTELAAGISLLAILGDAEFGGQGYAMAVDKDQAKIVFSKAATMIGLSPAFREHRTFEVLKTSIYCPELQASFKPLSSGPGGKHGFSPTFAIGDEVHEWPDGELADVVHKGTAARRQPLEIYITTAGINGEGYAWEMHELAESVLSGEIEDPTFLPVIFAAPADADWKAEATWRQANPGYGISVKPEYMTAEAAKAARSPRAENDFKRFHLNMWTEQVTRWLPMDRWARCTADPADRDLWKKLPERMRGRAAFGGLDLSITRDMTSLCWMFPHDDPEGPLTYIWRFWLPRESARNQPPRRRLRYERFVEAGALTLTDGDAVDYAYIEKQILADAEAFNICWLGFDRYNATELSIRLKDQHGMPVEGFGQGYVSMNPPSKEFERRIVLGGIEHGNNPVARWMAENVSTEQDPAGNIKPSKRGRGENAPKIDGIVAAIMGTGGWMGTAPVAKSIYEILATAGAPEESAVPVPHGDRRMALAFGEDDDDD